ncbi:MAG: hypothetical protein ACOY4W_16770 [Thermodesulfobacteriota bacterium]
MLRKQLEDYQAAEKKQQQEQTQGEIKDFAVEQNKQALAKINQLDPEAPDHNDQVALIWAEANLAVDEFRAGKQAQPVLPPLDDPATGQAPAAGGGEGEADAKALVNSMLQDAKFTDEEALIFWGMSRNAPITGPDGTRLTLQQQVSMTMEKARKYQADQRSRILQEHELPLDRGGAGGPVGGSAPAGQVIPISLDDALEQADRVRTLI